MDNNLSFQFDLGGNMAEEIKAITGSLSSMIDSIGTVTDNLDQVDNSSLNNLKKSVSQACNEIDQIANEFRKASNEATSLNSSNLKGLSSSANKATKDIDEISKSADSAFSDLKNLDSSNLTGVSSSANRAAGDLKDLGSAADKASSKIKDIGNTKIDIKGLDNVKKELEDAFTIEPSVGGSENLVNSMEALNNSVNLSNFLNLSEIIGNIADKIGDLGSAAMEASETVNNAFNKIQINLGLTDSETEKTVSHARAVLRDGYGESLEEVSNAVIQVSQNLKGVDDSNIEQLTKRALTLEGVLDSDMNETLRGVNALMTGFGITSDEAFDLIVKGTQNGLNKTQELGDNLAEYSARWGQAGVSASEYFSLLDAGLSNGAYQLDKVGDFLNEFLTSLIDGRMDESIDSFSEATKNVFETYKTGGADAQDVLNSVITDMQNMTSETDKAAIASSLWSSLGEDNALSMIMALGNVPDSYKDIAGAADEAVANNSTAIGSLKGLWEDFKLSLAPIGDAISSTVLGIINALRSVFSTIGGLIAGSISFEELTNKGLEAITNFSQGIMNGLPQAVTSGVQAATGFITGLQQSIPNFILSGIDMILALAQGFVSELPNIMSKGAEAFLAFTQGLKENLPTIVQTGIESAGNFLSGLFQRLPEFISVGMQFITNLLVGIVNNIPMILQGAINLIGAFVSTIWNNLPTILDAGWQIITSLISGLLKGAGTLVFEGFSLILKFGAAVISAIPQVASSLFSAAGDLVMGFVGGLASVWSTVGDWITSSFNWVIDFVKNLFGIASPSTVFLDIGKNLIQGFFNGIQEIWNNVTNWIGGAVNGFIDTVKGAWNSLFGGGEEEAPNIDYSETIAQTQAQLQLLTDNVSKAFANIVAQGKALNSQLAADTVATYMAMIPQIVSAVNILTNSIVAEAANINLGFSNIFNGLSAQALTYLANLRNIVVSQIGSIVASMTAGFSGLIGIFANIFTQIGIQSSTLLTSFSSTTTNILNSLISSIANIMQTLLASISSIFTGLVTIAVNNINLLYTNSVEYINQTKVTAVSIISAMSSSLINLYANLSSNVIATILTMTNTVITAITNLKTVVVTTISTFVSALLTLWNNLSSSLIAIVTSMSASILREIQNLVLNITKTMQTLVTSLRSIATEMMTQFRNGIQSQAGNVVSTASSLVEQLKNTFITGLGIHSPSKFMEYIGQMMLAGLMSGMSSSQVAGFVASTIEAMKTSFKNGKFNADELINYLGENSLSVVKYLEVIGDQTVSELFGDGGTPAIIQEALKYVGYAPGGGNSMFGLHYGNPGAWCASFVRYCAEQVGVPFPATNYVPDVLDWSIATGKYTQTPQPGYAAIFGGGSHIELVAGVSGGTVDMVGGNTGMGEVKHRPRNDATSYVALDGGHSTMTLKDTIMQAYNKKYNPLALAIGSTVNYNPSAGVAQWTDVVLQALQMLGQPASLLQGVLYAIENESGGNPNAINDWDSNAAMGDPSRGLLQTIGATFNAYRNPNLSSNIYDPLANVYAALNYMIQRYGSVANVVNPRLGGWYGYEVGTRYVPQDMLAMIHEGEAIIPAGQNPYSQSGGDYINDLFSDIEPRYETTGVSDSNGSNATVTISLVVNQDITEVNNPKQSANEIISILYNTLDEQHKKQGGGVNAIYG